MRKIVVTEFLSIDGVMEDPQEWHFPFFDDNAAKLKLDEVMETGALVLGRITWEGFAAAWPGLGRDMAREPEPTDALVENIFTDRFNWMPKYVVSDSLNVSDTVWNNTHLIRGNDLMERLTALKQEDGKHLYIHGSGKLVSSLVPTGLIDEYHLMVHPVIVGKGQRLFENGLPTTSMKLAGVTSCEKGIVVLAYVRDAAA